MIQKNKKKNLNLVPVSCSKGGGIVASTGWLLHFVFLKFTPQSCIWHVIEFFFVCLFFRRCCWIKSHQGGKTGSSLRRKTAGMPVVWVGWWWGAWPPRFWRNPSEKENVKWRKTKNKKFFHFAPFLSPRNFLKCPKWPCGFVTQCVCGG